MVNGYRWNCEERIWILEEICEGYQIGNDKGSGRKLSWVNKYGTGKNPGLYLKALGWNSNKVCVFNDLLNIIYLLKKRAI